MSAMDKRIDNMDEADDDADAADFDCVQLVNECLEKLAHERLTVQDVDQMIMDAFGWKDISPTLEYLRGSRADADADAPEKPQASQLLAVNFTYDPKNREAFDKAKAALVSYLQELSSYQSSSANVSVSGYESRGSFASERALSSSAKESNFVKEKPPILEQKDSTQDDEPVAKEEGKEEIDTDEEDGITNDSKDDDTIGSSSPSSLGDGGGNGSGGDGDARPMTNNHRVNATRKKKSAKRDKKSQAIKVVRKATVPRMDSADAGSMKGIVCRLCNNMFQAGEEISLLCCMHQYHHQCYDDWLFGNGHARRCPQTNTLH